MACLKALKKNLNIFMWAEATLLDIIGQTKSITQAVRSLSTAPVYLLPEGACWFLKVL